MLVHGGAGAAAAAAAAAEIARRMRKEEEEMTPYSDRDLSEGWEFKIMRSNTAAFKKPEQFRQMLNEEAEAGWQLVEKFDDSRVRLKRPRDAQANDAQFATSGRDPYRTNFGISQGMLVFWILFGIFSGMAALIGLIIALTR